MHTTGPTSITVEKAHFIDADGSQVDWVEIFSVYVILGTLLRCFYRNMRSINSTSNAGQSFVLTKTFHDHLSSCLVWPHNNLASDVIFQRFANSVDTCKNWALRYIESVWYWSYWILISKKPQCNQQVFLNAYRLSTSVLHASRKLWTVSKFYNKLFKCVRRNTKMANYNWEQQSPHNLRCKLLYATLTTSYLHKTGAETLLRHLLLVQIPPREILQQKLQNLQQWPSMSLPCCCSRCYRNLYFPSENRCLRVMSRALFQKRNNRFIDERMEWLFWNNPECILIPE